MGFGPETVIYCKYVSFVRDYLRNQKAERVVT